MLFGTLMVQALAWCHTGQDGAHDIRSCYVSSHQSEEISAAQAVAHFDPRAIPKWCSVVVLVVCRTSCKQLMNFIICNLAPLWTNLLYDIIQYMMWRHDIRSCCSWSHTSYGWPTWHWRIVLLQLLRISIRGLSLNAVHFLNLVFIVQAVDAERIFMFTIGLSFGPGCDMMSYRTWCGDMTTTTGRVMYGPLCLMDGQSDIGERGCSSCCSLRSEACPGMLFMLCTRCSLHGL